MTRRDLYWLGYRHGRHLAEHDPLYNHQPRLELEAALASRKHRAFALGELRGYRHALRLPEPTR